MSPDDRGETPEVYEAVVAQLMTEPHRMSVAEIAGLTDRQIIDLAAHRRDEHGKIALPEAAGAARPPAGEDVFDTSFFHDMPDTPENQRLALFAVGGALGIPAEELEAAWQDKLERDRRAAGGEAAGAAGGAGAQGG